MKRNNCNISNNMSEYTISCMQCNRKTNKSKVTKKFCSNRCRVKFHRIKHGHPLVKPGYDPFEMIQCNIESCPNCGMGLARSILNRMGCNGGCLR